MKGGKREGAGRKPSANPYTTQPAIRMTPAQHARLKTLGGSAWVRQQIDLAEEKAGPTSLSSAATCAARAAVHGYTCDVGPQTKKPPDIAIGGL